LVADAALSAVDLVADAVLVADRLVADAAVFVAVEVRARPTRPADAADDWMFDWMLLMISSSRVMSDEMVSPKLFTCSWTSERMVSSSFSVFLRLRSTRSLTASWTCSVWTSPALRRSLTISSAFAWVMAVKVIPASRYRLRRSF
jgi:hypothetical protein